MFIKCTKLILNKEYRMKCVVRLYLSIIPSNRIKKMLRSLLYDYIYVEYHVVIGRDALVDASVSFPHFIGIVIGDKVKIGRKCTIFQNVTLGKKNGCYPTIGNGVTIFAGSVIVGDITIGDNSVIGANSFVDKDVPENSCVAGVPARVINRW